MSDLEIRKAVKERYSKLATSSEQSCCGGDSCDTSSLITIGEAVPVEASSINAGCGSPLLLVTPKEGDVVVDLGSGGGIDIFRASQKVGASGKAIGVDATPEMIWRVGIQRQSTATRYSNVEFRLGEIEHLPIESNSVDYIISNCVINLSPDKLAVFRESFRVLKQGGMFAVADVTLPREIPENARKDMDSWSACMAGALIDSDNKKLLQTAGFKDIENRACIYDKYRRVSVPLPYSHIKARKST